MPPDHAHIDKLSLVLQSGDPDRIHYAFVMAAAAVATDIPVTLFFTRDACRTLLPGGFATLQGANGQSGAEQDIDFKAKGIGTFEDLLQACVALGARFIVCEMGLKAVGVSFDDLRDDLGLEQAGVVTFLTDASPNGLSLYI